MGFVGAKKEEEIRLFPSLAPSPEMHVKNTIFGSLGNPWLERDKGKNGGSVQLGRITRPSPMW